MNVNFMRAELWECKFIRAELSFVNVNFMRAEFLNVNFMRAELCECEFYESWALRM